MSDIDGMNVGLRWYVAHTYSGYENKVKANLEKIVENRGLGHLIFDVRVPVETTIVTNEKGEQKEVESKIFPSYVLVKMAMTDESWHVVRNITGVTGFVGPGSRPVPLSDAEVESFGITEDSSKKELKLKVGMKVKAISGMFEGYSGVLQEISEDQKQLTVLISTEKRDIPIIVESKDVVIDE